MGTTPFHLEDGEKEYSVAYLRHDQPGLYGDESPCCPSPRQACVGVERLTSTMPHGKADRQASSAACVGGQVPVAVSYPLSWIC